jgi:hypothetical protein
MSRYLPPSWPGLLYLLWRGMGISPVGPGVLGFANRENSYGGCSHPYLPQSTLKPRECAQSPTSPPSEVL